MFLVEALEFLVE
jgi:hypothetical protein